MKIGFMGPKGTFSHEAANIYVQNKVDYILCDYSTIADAILAVQNGEIDQAIIPIENSLEGAVNVTMDMMSSDVDLKIRDEVVILVEQNLLVKRGTRREDIQCILSHPQAIGQCRQYIHQHHPQAEVRVVYSTAGAAEEVAKGAEGLAAIGSMAAAEAYNLEILSKGIQDGQNNRTRFVVVAREDNHRSGTDKTSIVFSTEHKSGGLYRVLDIFSLWDINMTRIESRPAKNQLGRYVFFVDIIGHREDEDVRDALTMVRRKSSFYKFLGSYPTQTIDG